MQLPEHLVLIDKPAGITSHTAVGRAKKKFGVRKAGHAGTLDPMATGLLIVGLDTGTKLLGQYVGLDKTYEAVVRLGQRTDTGDIEGAVLETHAVASVTEAQAAAAIAKLLGTQRLPVPQYAATKVRGTPLYKLAREGKAVPHVERDMEIHEARVTGVSCADGRCDVACVFTVGSGTYIRSLAERLGELLGYPATLAALRRTAVGDFSVQDAVAV